MSPDGSWRTLPSHVHWLAAECDRLLDFGEAAATPSDGFAWLDTRGAPDPAKPTQTWVTARMTHVYSLATLMGRPGSAPLVDAGLAALAGRLHDEVNGGWYAAIAPDGTPDTTKQAYEHAFVVLAASSAAVAGRPGAEDLLADALDVLATRFWREDEGMLAESAAADWSDPEPYRGVNANMHGVEAMLAAADATGDAVWRDRAARVVDRVVHHSAAANGWRLVEHHDADWHPLPDYNTDDRAHPFRPYGVTIGHLLEWARLVLHLRAALGAAAPDHLLDDARALFDRAVTDGWSVDGAEGFVYTTDFDGAPVVRERMHWVLAEAIGAAAALHEVTGEDPYEQWYRTWWDSAARHFLDPGGGSWWHELGTDLRPSGTVWSGKPDTYHAVQATLVPRLPLAPSFATALARHGLRDGEMRDGAAPPDGGRR